MTQVTPTDMTGTAPVEGTTPQTATEQQIETKETAKQDDASLRFAQMARREKILRSRAREIETREQALKAKEQEYSQPRPQDNSWRERLAQDPMGVLAEAGLNYEQITQMLLNQNPADLSVRQLEAKLKSLEENQTKVLNQVEEQQKNAYNQALNQIRTEVKHLSADTEQFEVLGLSGKQGQEAVVKLIEKTFQEDGYLMDVEEAAREVEEYLTEQALGLAQLKKIQSKLNPKPTTIETTPPLERSAQDKGFQIKPKTQPTTLTHSMTQSSKPLTSKERVQRAIAVFNQGKLT